jgi:uncharacterized alpha-E superfamily protein
LISRVAESCYWMNRYVERVETLARILDVNLSFQLDVDLPDAERWRPLVVVTGQEKPFLAEAPADRVDDAEFVQGYLVWSESNRTSIRSSLFWARENARTIRETISLEMFETLNDLWVWLGARTTRRLYDQNRHGFYLHLRNATQLFHGVSHGTMLHEDPFEFMRLGTALERVNQTARVLDVKHHAVGPDSGIEMPDSAAQWLATLRFCAGVEPFFKRAENVLSGSAVANFLLFDTAFPRSVHHNLLRARNFLTLVRPLAPASVGEASWQRLGELIDRFEALSIEEVLRRGLHEVLTWVVENSARVGDQIQADFFDPAPTPALHPPAPQTQSQESAS